MKTRYRHVMAQTKGSKQPDVVIGVACDTHREQVEGRQGVERIRLDRWYAVGMVRDGGSLSSRFESAGSDASGFWGMCENLGARYRHIFIVSSSAVLDWSLLELWESMEDGRVKVVGNAGQGNQTSPVTDDARARGFIVTEDPPSILYAYLREGGTLIRWVDSRNYGIGGMGYLLQGYEGSSALCRFATGMIAELDARKLGALKDTSASQSLYSFRRKHLGSLIVCHTVGEVLELEKSAYISGRCECGRIGRVEGPIYELDIRGSYLYSCAWADVPVRLRDYQLSTASGEVPDLGTGRGFIGTVCIETDTPDYPVRRKGITIFPVGRLKTTLCGPELQDALDRGRVVKWHAWAEYDLEPALAGFAGEVYDMRCQAEARNDVPIARWAKALAVALVGKLGQRGRSWQWLPDLPPRHYYDQYYARHTDGRVYRFQEIAGYHRMERLEQWAPDAVPAISAWICGTARMRLLSMLRSCGMAECLYRDTDSLFVTGVGYDKLCAAGWVKPGQLGYLQLKGVHAWMEIHGLKMYQTPALHRMAGTSGSGHTAVLDAAAHRQSVWLSTYLQMGSRPDSLSVAIPKSKMQPYRHGNVTAGGRVEPLRVWED